MSSQVTVSLLITIVLLNVVQIVTTDDNSAFHLVRNDNSSEDATTNRNAPSEGALLINVSTSNGLLRSLETKTNILVPTGTLTLGDDALVVLEDGLLLLERTVGLKLGEERGGLISELKH